MTAPPAGQQNRYKGINPRGWVRVTLVAPDGTSQECELIADTGCPFDMVLDSPTLGHFQERPGPPQPSTWGSLVSGPVRLLIPEVGFDVTVLACAVDSVVREAQADAPDFAGLLGLPLLRTMEYGGDTDWFWIRPQGATP